MFDFMDLFPDSKAAVVGSQGARDNMADRYKSAMGFMELEKAMRIESQQQKQQMLDEALMPEKVRLQRIQQLQGINTLDPNALSGALENPDVIGKITPISDAYMKQKQAEITNELMMNKVKYQQGETTGRNIQDNTTALTKATAEADDKQYQEFKKNWEIPPNLTNKKRFEAFLADVRGLTALGNPRITRQLVASYGSLIPHAAPGPHPGEKPDVIGKVNPIGSKPNEPQPVTYTSKSGKKYMIDPKGGVKEL